MSKFDILFPHVQYCLGYEQMVDNLYVATAPFKAKLEMDSSSLVIGQTFDVTVLIIDTDTNDVATNLKWKVFT